MRWDDLFDDLEGQLEASEQAEQSAELSDWTRIEVSRLRLIDRLRAASGAALHLTLVGTGPLTGSVQRVGADWLVLGLPTGATALVSLPAVAVLRDLPAPAMAAGSEGPVLSRLTLAHALRGIARDRAAVSVGLRSGGWLSGTIDRVGSDVIDIAEHPVAEPRRRGTVSAMATVPLTAIAVVRSG